MAFVSGAERYRRSAGRLAAGIRNSVRDTDLTPEQAERYQPGTIFWAPGITEGRMSVNPPETTHRFLIFSDHMEHKRERFNGTDLGIMGARDARFKVLDVYERDGRTQITLLHLPDREEWKLYREYSGEAEQRLAAEGRKHFDRYVNAEPVPALEAPDWKERCAAPVGMDAEGNLYDPDPEGEDALYPVMFAGFRDFFHRFVYFARTGFVEAAAGKLLAEGDTGVIAYGYFDEHKGLTFRLMAGASLAGRTVTIGKRLDDASVTWKRRDVEKEKYLPLPNDLPDLEQFREREGVIRAWFDTRDPALKQLRDMEELDEWRTPNYPDHVRSFLFRPGQMPEEAWVKPNRIVDGEISGELLMDPKGDFGVHMGSVVPVRIFEKKDGSSCLISFINDRDRPFEKG